MLAGMEEDDEKKPIDRDDENRETAEVSRGIMD